MRKTTTIVAGAAMALAALPAVALAAAHPTATIDFEGLAEGAVVSSVSVGSGISGDAIPGNVAIDGINPALAGNQAMIFDATCTPSATGQDSDLCVPGLGNVLIVSEDGDTADPDDADVVGAKLEADFSGFGPGVVDVASVTIIDVDGNENDGSIVAYAPGGAVLATVPIPTIGDNSSQVLAVNASGVERLVVNLNGSGAIDNVEVAVEPPPPPPPPPPGEEGCTPGYWKQAQHYWAWDVAGVSPDSTVGDVFGDSIGFADVTLLDALSLRGNRDGQALVRHAVAAYLNASSPDVAYPWSLDTILEVAASGDKGPLEWANELGCDLGNGR